MFWRKVCVEDDKFHGGVVIPWCFKAAILTSCLIKNILEFYEENESISKTI